MSGAIFAAVSTERAELLDVLVVNVERGHALSGETQKELLKTMQQLIRDKQAMKARGDAILRVVASAALNARGLERALDRILCGEVEQHEAERGAL